MRSLSTTATRSPAARAAGAVGGEAVVAAEAGRHRRRRGERERVGVVAEVIADEGDVVVVEGGEERRDVARLDAREVGHQHHRRRRAA